MFKIKSNSVLETEKIAKRFVQKLKGNEIIAFTGTMGMGKTTFTRALAEALNIKETVCSPTFAIVNEYNGKFKIYHFDMYKIHSFEDLYSTGFFDYEGLIIIEWSENIEDFLEGNIIKIKIEIGQNINERIFMFEGIENFYENINT